MLNLVRAAVAGGVQHVLILQQGSPTQITINDAARWKHDVSICGLSNISLSRQHNGCYHGYGCLDI